MTIPFTFAIIFEVINEDIADGVIHTLFIDN